MSNLSFGRNSLGEISIYKSYKLIHFLQSLKSYQKINNGSRRTVERYSITITCIDEHEQNTELFYIVLIDLVYKVIEINIELILLGLNRFCKTVSDNHKTWRQQNWCYHMTDLCQLGLETQTVIVHLHQNRFLSVVTCWNKND